MSSRLRALMLLLVVSLVAWADDASGKGQRIFITGHSFHVPIVKPLGDVAKAAGLTDHKLIGQQGLGGSRVIQHWNLPDDKDKARAAIRTGKVDVLTVSPHALLPDEGIDRFVELALKHNPEARVLVQASWSPFDGLQNQRGTFKNEQRDSAKPDSLRQAIEPFTKKLAHQIDALNAKYKETHKRQVVFLVPVGDAVVSLRQKVVDKQLPGITKQSELFRDHVGHGKAEIAVVSAYCHYAVIYRKSPVGLRGVTMVASDKETNEKVHRVLQEVAWDAVTKEPLSGVKK